MTRAPRLGFGTIALLRALDEGRRFGFDLMDATGLTSGTVYPALDRLEDLGFVKSEWEDDAVARRDARPARRYFTITKRGGKALADALERYPALRVPARTQAS